MVYANKSFTISAVLQRSWRVIKTNVYPLLILAAAFSLLIILASVITGISAGGFFAKIFAILFVLSVFMSMCAFTFKLCSDGQADFKKLIPNLAHTFNGALFCILISIVSVPIFIAFIFIAAKLYASNYRAYIISLVAFLIFYHYFFYFRTAFTALAYVEGLSAIEGITASFDLTRGNFLRLLVVFILCFVLAAAGFLFFIIGASLTVPLALVIYSCAYLELNELDFHSQQNQDEVETLELLQQTRFQENKEKEQKASSAFKENEEEYLGKGTSVADYTNINDNIISPKNKEKK